MKKFTKLPFLRLLLFLILGICGGFYFPTFPSLFFVSVFVLLCMITYFLKKKKSYYSRITIGMNIAIFFIYTGFSLAKSEQKQRIDSFEHYVERMDYFPAKIIDVPIEKNKTIQLHLIALLDTFPYRAKIQVYIQKNDESLTLKENDWLFIESSILIQKQTKTLGTFDYAGYLRQKGFSGSFYLPADKWILKEHTSSVTFLSCSHAVQKYLVGIFRNFGIRADELGVLAALSIGDKTMLDKDLKNGYSITGASHILAVSGLHVGVVFLVFTQMISLILRGEQWQSFRIVLSLCMLWLFTFVTGLSPSVVRASIMLTMLTIAPLIGRKSLTYNTVFASAFIMLIYSPSYLFDVGFQLSYAAVLSILLFQPILYRAVVARNIVQEKMWSLLSVSLAAQLGTMPLTLYYFHQISNLFWLSGFVVIPVSTVLLYLSISLWSLQWIPYVGNMLAFMLNNLTKGMNWSILKMETWYGAVHQNIQFGRLDLFALYLLLMLLFRVVEKHSFHRLSMLLIVLFVYTIYQTINKFFFVT